MGVLDWRANGGGVVVVVRVNNHDSGSLRWLLLHVRLRVRLSIAISLRRETRRSCWLPVLRIHTWLIRSLNIWVSGHSVRDWRSPTGWKEGFLVVLLIHFKK